MNPLHRDPIVNLHLHEIQPNVQLHIKEGGGDLEYPAPWIWNLIGEDRDNLVSLDYKPVTGPNGGIEIDTWCQPGKSTHLARIRVQWRLCYIDATGREVTKSRDFLIHTGIPMPSLRDAGKEHELMQRLKLVIAANCVPVVQSMDRSQSRDEFWDRVDDVVAARVFIPHRDNYQTQNNLYEKALVLFGPDTTHLGESVPIELVNKQREIIYIPPRAGRSEKYCVGPEITKSSEAHKTIQVDEEWTDVFNHRLWGLELRP